MNHTLLIRNAVILLFCTIRAIYSLKCYKCSPLPRQVYYQNQTNHLCSKFDYSEKYIVDCPYSTSCMKKIYSVNLTGNATNGTERDCANQKYEYQKYKDGRWQTEVAVEKDLYKEGCLLSDDKGFKISRTMYCYCKGNLCNRADHIAQLTLSEISVIIFIFYFLL